MYHARTKKWAAGVWERYSEWDDQEHQAPGGTPPQAAPSPIAQFQILFGKRGKRPPVQQLHRTKGLPSGGKPPRSSTDVRDLGATMVKIMEAQAESSLRLHKNLLENIQATGAAVGATGTTRDARLSEAKLRILQAYARQDDGLPFTPSKLYLEVDREGGTTGTFSRVLCRLVVMVPGSPHKCNVHITAKIVSAAKPSISPPMMT
jgi:hypothetical protein